MPTTVRCPTCRQGVSWEGNPSRPFCSERCRLLDLGNWASGRYRIPGEATPDSVPAEPDSEEGTSPRSEEK